MEDILRHGLLALLETPGTTLLSLQRLLVEPNFRRSIVGRVTDPVVRAYWEQTFAGWNDRFRSEAISPVQNKRRTFLANPLTRTHCVFIVDAIWCSMSIARLDPIETDSRWLRNIIDAPAEPHRPAPYHGPRPDVTIGARPCQEPDRDVSGLVFSTRVRHSGAGLERIPHWP